MRIVLTGSSSGIGQHLACVLTARGHEVWGLARSPQTQHPAASSGRFRSTTTHVADWDSVARAAEEVRTAWGAVHAVIACAGVQGEVGPAMAADPKAWSETVRINLDGTFFALRAFHSLLATEPRAKVICFSGGGSTKSRPHFSAYAAAKTGVVRLVETLAEEWKTAPVDINAIAPGAVPTRMTDEVLALGPERAGKAEYDGALKLKQAGQGPLDKAAALVEFLLSSDSDGISGRLLSAPWDPWRHLHSQRERLASSDIYQLRRILPEERGEAWSSP